MLEDIETVNLPDELRRIAGLLDRAGPNDADLLRDAANALEAARSPAEPPRQSAGAMRCDECGLVLPRGGIPMSDNKRMCIRCYFARG